MNSNSLVYERLHQNLLDLKLNGVEEILDSYLEIAAKDGTSVMEILDHLMHEEKMRRERLISLKPG
jgi:DNA replication protein DnaC